MAEVCCIFEENHGFIGVATTPNATAHWLIDSGWVNKKSDWYDEKSGDFILLEEVVPDSYMGEWENWFIDQVEENGTEFLENLGFQMVEEELAGKVEDLLPRGRFG